MNVRSQAATRRILVVDDEAPILSVTARALERLGHEPVLASSGNDAGKRFADDPASIDLLVTDVMMPGIDGIELARRLRAQRPDLPVIVTSGFGEPGDLDDVGGEAHVSFLPKPYTLESLSAHVARALGEPDGHALP